MRGASRILAAVALTALMSAASNSSAEAGQRHPPTAPRVTRASVSSAGAQGDQDSSSPKLSRDGRYVAFHSNATTLVPGDSNGLLDVFVHDSRTGRTTRVSVSSAGAQGNGRSAAPSLSSDARYVTFWSEADNLVPGDTNGVRDVFVHDLRTGRTTRVSRSSAGAQGNGPSDIATLSADGQVVAFRSAATNLAPGDTNGVHDVFVHDRRTGKATRINVSSTGTQANGSSFFTSLSANGRYAAFESDASNLVSGDTNDAADVFVRDRWTGKTFRASVATSGDEGDPSEGSGRPTVSDDGRYISFMSDADNLVPGDVDREFDVFVRDRRAGTTHLLSSTGGRKGNGRSQDPIMTPDGRYVAYASEADNLVSGDTNGLRDMFVHDRRTGTTRRVTVSAAGEQANGDTWAGGSLSADARQIAYASNASNLVPRDTNTVADVFVHEQARPHRPRTLGARRRS
jgi:Tol biopolymer transport system component